VVCVPDSASFAVPDSAAQGVVCVPDSASFAVPDSAEQGVVCVPDSASFAVPDSGAQGVFCVPDSARFAVPDSVAQGVVCYSTHLPNLKSVASYIPEILKGLKFADRQTDVQTDTGHWNDTAQTL